MVHIQATKGIDGIRMGANQECSATHHETDRDRRSAILEHGIITAVQAGEPRAQSVRAADTTRFAVESIKHDWMFQADLFNVAAAVTLSVGPIDSLREDALPVWEVRSQLKHGHYAGKSAC
jgi:hypothetical protein